LVRDFHDDVEYAESHLHVQHIELANQIRQESQSPYLVDRDPNPSSEVGPCDEMEVSTTIERRCEDHYFKLVVEVLLFSNYDAGKHPKCYWSLFPICFDQFLN
jgi:hypothetical protein